MFQDPGQSQENAPKERAKISPALVAGYQDEDKHELGMKDSGQDLGLLIGKAKFGGDIEQEIIDQVGGREEQQAGPADQNEITPLIILIQTNHSLPIEA